MKKFLQFIIHTIIDSLFPISEIEKELFSTPTEKVFELFPKSRETPIQNTYSIFHYKDERVSKMIWNIKYKKSQKAVEIGSYALQNKILEIINKIPKQNNIDTIQKITIIPTPITNHRKKERGYNQCEILLDEIERLFTKSSSIGDELSPKIIFEKNLLEKIHHNSRQTLKNRKDRLDSAKGIFGVNKYTAIKYTKSDLVIIIDDVITTGSTIKEAMRALDDAGFKNVIGLSIAH